MRQLKVIEVNRGRAHRVIALPSGNTLGYAKSRRPDHSLPRRVERAVDILVRLEVQAAEHGTGVTNDEHRAAMRQVEELQAFVRGMREAQRFSRPEDFEHAVWATPIVNRVAQLMSAIPHAD